MVAIPSDILCAVTLFIFLHSTCHQDKLIYLFAEFIVCLPLLEYKPHLNRDLAYLIHVNIPLDQCLDIVHGQ